MRDEVYNWKKDAGHGVSLLLLHLLHPDDLGGIQVEQHPSWDITGQVRRLVTPNIESNPIGKH